MKKLIISLLVITFISCDSSRVYNDFHDMEQGFWHLDSIQTFNFEITETEKNYNLIATFRNSSGYLFYNLYFQYTLRDSLENILDQELKEVNFFDPKTGEPFGSGLGDLFDHSYPLSEDYTFPHAGEYSISFEQFMRMDTLPHILSVGLRLEFAE